MLLHNNLTKGYGGDIHIIYKKYPPVHPTPLIKVTHYRQDLVPLLESAIQRCSSIFFYFGHINATVIHNILLVHAPYYVEPQAWKKKKQIKRFLSKTQ